MFSHAAVDEDHIDDSSHHCQNQCQYHLLFVVAAIGSGSNFIYSHYLFHTPILRSIYKLKVNAEPSVCINYHKSYNNLTCWPASSLVDIV